MMFDDSQALSPEDEPEDMDATAESESSSDNTPSDSLPSPDSENNQSDESLQDSVENAPEAEGKAGTEQENTTVPTTDELRGEQAIHSFASQIRIATAPARTAWRTATAPIRAAWHHFTSLRAIRFIINFFRNPDSLWRKRHRFSFSLYAIVFTLLTVFEVIFIQWGMYSEPEYADGQEIDDTTKILNSVARANYAIHYTNMA